MRKTAKFSRSICGGRVTVIPVAPYTVRRMPPASGISARRRAHRLPFSMPVQPDPVALAMTVAEGFEAQPLRIPVSPVPEKGAQDLLVIQIGIQMMVGHLPHIVLMIVAVGAQPVPDGVLPPRENIILRRNDLIGGDVGEILQGFHLRVTDKGIERRGKGGMVLGQRVGGEPAVGAAQDV